MAEPPVTAGDQDGLDLSRPPETLRRGMLLGTMAAAGIAFVGFLALSPTLPVLVDAAPAVYTVALVLALAAAWLLRMHREIDHDPALAWMGSAYVLSAVAMATALLSFPDLVPTDFALGIDPDETAALYLSWHTVIAVLALVALSPAADRRWLRRSIVGVSFVLIAAAATGWPEPAELVAADGTYTSFFRGMLTVVTAVSATALWAWIIASGREQTWPRAMVTAALGLHTWDLILYGFAERRFSVSWWASLGTRLAAFAVLTAGLLIGARAVFRSLDGYAGRLASLVTERDQATRELTAANEELQAFAHVVAHDLRSPLTGASGFVDLARATPTGLPSDVAELLDRASTQHRRMEHLITDLLDYAEVTNADLHREWVSLAEVGREVVRDRDADGVVTLEALPAVLGDRPRLRQLLDNLVGNALKYVPPGVEPHVRVWAEPHGEDGVAVHVDDNGIGIDPERAEEIFRPFVRTSDARAGYPGTGIGLAICQRVVEQHAGTIHAAPRDAGGTRFTFTLPRSADDDASVASRGRSRSGEGSTPVAERGVRRP
ncbi:sensor histidine kinase [Egicoccus halophilus]|uniref:Sensor-like histidine kinase SenX3 n=1 Tax=Egicoccus halophilus TaxID=1670830 RepID=A0A8J3A6I1_9ACTN|nr:HAMP domain-containing sensor histidine kinase [Egicoccus halophilus]GGI04677.1 hypothetical protein GCM10011354_10290 [Egicoccus halophilus]